MSLALPIALVLIVFVIYAFTRTRSRKKEAFPANWHQLLLEHVHFYKQLSETEQKRFQQRVMTFLSETYIEGVDFEPDELDTVLVAASAVIPVFAFSEWHYTNLSTVLIYPDHFNEDLDFDADHKERFIAGMIGTGRFEHQMILSRKALHEGFDRKRDMQNTGIHEFVHLIDKVDGVTDGIPERLIEHSYVVPWLKRIHKEMEEINADQSDIRSYGGTNEAEFFAVASEYFFEQPNRMRVQHPELYKMLTACFHLKQK
ncbi:zinc-dependent peptidase [Leeuwenhoekiella sp. H156]|uniref:M90 family metallopeptidase n=1 Tax=Leeuwenhoekiella sp. H156 TaxID=3450128 RepID=UPI003FA48707